MPQDGTQTTRSYSQRRHRQIGDARFRHGTLQTVQKPTCRWRNRDGRPVNARTAVVRHTVCRARTREDYERWRKLQSIRGSGNVQGRIGRVKLPFLSLDSLIASKETFREEDASDRLRLLELKRPL
jgi:hypothetical protein